MRMYSLEDKSVNQLKSLKDLVAVNPDLTIDEKHANIKAIEAKLDPTRSTKLAYAQFEEGKADVDDLC